MNKVALIVGHSQKDGGAVNQKHGMNEFRWNDALVRILAGKLAAHGSFEPVVIYRDTYSGLPAKVNQTGADVAIEFHCNAFNTQASGSETLHYKGSRNGEKLASDFQAAQIQALGLSNRGVKAIDKDGRGGYLLQKTTMPCIITEPFFIDNDRDLLTATQKQVQLADAYVTALEEYYDLAQRPTSKVQDFLNPNFQL